MDFIESRSRNPKFSVELNYETSDCMCLFIVLIVLVVLSGDQ